MSGSKKGKRWSETESKTESKSPRRTRSKTLATTSRVDVAAKRTQIYSMSSDKFQFAPKRGSNGIAWNAGSDIVSYAPGKETDDCVKLTRADLAAEVTTSNVFTAIAKGTTVRVCLPLDNQKAAYEITLTAPFTLRNMINSMNEYYKSKVDGEWAWWTLENPLFSGFKRKGKVWMATFAE